MPALHQPEMSLESSFILYKTNLPCESAIKGGFNIIENQASRTQYHTVMLYGNAVKLDFGLNMFND